MLTREDKMRGILMAVIIAATIALQLLGCETPPIHDRQDEAVELVASVFVEAGLRDPRPVSAIWYVEQRCIPSPFDPHHDTRCRVGRSVLLGFVCQIEVVWRGGAISRTSFAHEMLHCSILDPSHSRPEWQTVLPAANQVLENAGL